MAANGVKQCLFVQSLDSRVYCPLGTMGHLGLLKDNDEDITIFQGNRYPQLRSAKLPLHSESDDLKGGNNAGVRSTRLDRRGFLKGLLTWCVFADDV